MGVLSLSYTVQCAFHHAVGSSARSVISVPRQLSHSRIVAPFHPGWVENGDDRVPDRVVYDPADRPAHLNVMDRYPQRLAFHEP